MMTDFRAQFDFSADRGFLPAEDPLQEAPADAPASMKLLEKLCALTPKLLLTGTLRESVDKLPYDVFEDIVELSKQGESRVLRLAMAQLSFLAHAYMWGGKEPIKVLPAVIAHPWAVVSKSLGRPPILSYASYCLDNWHRIDKDKPIALDNIALIHNFLAGVDEHWFVTIHVAIENAAGPALLAAFEAAEESAKETPDLQKLEKHLASIADALQTMDQLFARMPERCDPYVYYHRVRPFIFGTKNNPDLPEGLVYEGEFDGIPQLYRGETGAQSSILPVLDGALGVHHSEDQLRHYLNEMRIYMPPRHRAFIEHLETLSKVRDLVASNANANATSLQAEYNRCLEGLRIFRTRHLEYAASYIHKQNKTNTQVGSGGSTEWGTGGTPFLPYLKKHRDETAEQKIGCPAAAAAAAAAAKSAEA